MSENTEYGHISKIYDLFTDGFDYDKYLDKIFEFTDLPKKGLALDCGCGTGTLLLKLNKRGYDCTGVDISPEMLDEAREKLADAGYDAHLICQALEKIDLYGAYDVAFCSLDTLNHLVGKKDMSEFIRRMYNFTEPGGFFIFDAKTPSAFAKTAGTRCFENDGITLIIQGDVSRKFAFYGITSFIPAGNNLFRMEDTQIQERIYDLKELSAAVKSAGFDVAKRFTFNGRYVFICKKTEK